MQVLPKLTDSRRLTGANLFWERPCAIIDLEFSGDLAPFIAAWQSAARSLIEATGHGAESLRHRVFAGGASLLISAPIDALYSMCELNEAAFKAALAARGGAPVPGQVDEIKRLQGLFATEANPALLALQAAAVEHDVPFLWDDDAVSIGHGATTQQWPPRELPAPKAVDWSK
ncbi:MAG TPA: hypothetical protein VJ766_00235, partial [Pseudoxanthomonas sp.]|nr:hypothetical protein [Pseudoxanthomonas sp.]